MKNIIKIKFFVLAILALFIFSCSKEISFDLNPNDKTMVLNAWLNSGDPIRVELSKNLLITERGRTGGPITDANVSLYENGEFLLELAHEFDGKYKADEIQLKSGFDYEIVAERPSGERCSAKEFSPDNLGNFTSFNYTLDYVLYVNPYEENYYLTILNFEIKEMVNFPDYVLLSFQEKVSRINLNDAGAMPEVKLFSVPFWNPNSLNPAYHSIDLKPDIYFLLIDKSKLIVDGAHLTLQLPDVRKNEVILGDNNYLDKYEYAFQVHSISESLAKYLSSLRDNKYSNDFFQTPTQLYNNVEGGNGIFGLSFHWSFPVDEEAP